MGNESFPFFNYWENHSRVLSLLGAMVGVACLVEVTQFGRFGPFVGNEQGRYPLQAIRGRGASPPATLPAHDRDSRRPSRSSWCEARPDSLYAVTEWVKDPPQCQGNDAVRVAVADVSGTVAEKWLHSADLDFYLTSAARG